MTLSEFDLIKRYFSDCGARRDDVVLGVGDDAALLRAPAGTELAVTLDTLIEGVHFLPGTDPESLGYKALAVNLSDLAAMGAEAAWVTLSLSLPSSDTDWVAAFSQGFCALAREFDVRLVGGDTTRGPLAISVSAKGLVPAGQALRRRGAQCGDLIFVTGTLGDAALGLKVLLEQVTVDDPDYLRHRLERPQPRLAVGQALRGLATSAIDISDGLAADLGHILSAGGVGAVVELERLPCSRSVTAYLERTGDWSLPLSGGDDYELCFTLPSAKLAAMESFARIFPCSVTRIGEIVHEPGLHLRGPVAEEFHLEHTGYDHFADAD
jgi:thiamine-monophosphate kinase